MARVKNKDIVKYLEDSLKHADQEDDFQRYGEGYTGLRQKVQALITTLKKED